VAKPLKTEEQLKADIFNIYSKYRDEQSSDRRKVCVERLWEFIICWCISYNNIPEAKEMGLEIFNAVKRIVEKTLKEEKDFFSYLSKALKNAKAEYYRKDISNINKLPREVKVIKKFISLQENNAGRMLSEEEKIERISKWFNKTEKKAKECLHRIENKDVVSLTTIDDEGKEIDISDSNYEPESIFFSKLNTPDFRKAVESVLQSKQERTRECYRALFTAHCINNSIDFEGAASVLNAEILEKHLKDGKKPDQYEVYKMYHPEVKKKSAEVRASDMLKTFLNDLRTALKERI
jgi:hypothetical protein